jgi:type III pantothenate kinase
MKYLLTIDIGNTNIDIGLFCNNELESAANISTQDNKSEFEIASSIVNLLHIENEIKSKVETIISSVVPNKTHIVSNAAKIITSKDPIIVDHNFNFPFKNVYNPPTDVGLDRLVDSLAAIKLYGTPCVILDIGTCLVFDAITKDNEYLGGSILPGLFMAADSLFKSTALLKPVDLKIPKNVIGRSTEESIQSGIILGYVELIEGTLKAYKEQLSNNNEKINFVITGGGSYLITPNLKSKYIFNEYLSLLGLKYSYDL